MMSGMRSVAVAGALLLGSGALADDVPFGADSLHHLAREATVIIRAVEPRRVETKERPGDQYEVSYITYSVAVAESLKGGIEKGRDLRVAFISTLNVQTIEQLHNSILFLEVLSDDLIKRSNIPPGKDTFAVVSGRHGTVGLKDEKVVESVKLYLLMAESPQLMGSKVLDWTSTNIHAADPFLQRSAVVELFYRRKAPQAVDQLGAVLASAQALPSTKSTAIRALAGSGTQAAYKTLAKVAENSSESARLREQAVMAFRNIPGGTEQLQLWTASPDPLLSGAAKQAQ